MSFANTTAVVTAPVKGKNIWRIPATAFGTAASLTVPDDWKNAILNLRASGGDWAFCFSKDATASASTASDASTISDTTPPTITAIGANMVELKDGESMSVDLRPVADSLLAFIELEGGGGDLIVWRASGAV